MRLYRLKPFLLGGIFLLVLYLAGSGRGAIPIFRLNQAQANTPIVTYLPAIAHNKVYPPPPNSPPLASTSYYFFMGDYDPLQVNEKNKAWSLGCQLGKRDLNTPGKQDSVVILAFGIPKYRDGRYGASGMHAGKFYNLDQITHAVQNFGFGYWWCVGADFDSHLRIAVGTNNYTKSTATDVTVTYGHGRAWAQMVNRINDYFRVSCPRGCDGQVSVVGASDIELAWSSPQVAKDWVNGYASANLYPLYNFGAAEGCPFFARPNWTCGNSEFRWSNELVFQITNAGPAYPLPEIYHNDGIHAQQWYLLSVYSANTHGYPYRFVGTLTTYGACQQRPNDTLCPIIDNKPEEGWTQLYTLINGSNLATWTSLRYSTDIMWAE
jgi:hypothetical protein